MQKECYEKCGIYNCQSQSSYKVFIPGMKEFFNLLPDGIRNKIADDDLV